MRDIKPVGSYGVTLDKDVAASLEGLWSGKRYVASELHERYRRLVRADGRVPGHPVAFGQALKRLGCTRVKLTYEGRQVIGWVVK